jgi:hypothetical protein
MLENALSGGELACPETKNLPFAGLGRRALAIDGNATAGEEGCDDAAGKQNFVLISHN